MVVHFWSTKTTKATANGLRYSCRVQPHELIHGTQARSNSRKFTVHTTGRDKHSDDVIPSSQSSHNKDSCGNDSFISVNGYLQAWQFFDNLGAEGLRRIFIWKKSVRQKAEKTIRNAVNLARGGGIKEDYVVVGVHARTG